MDTCAHTRRKRDSLARTGKKSARGSSENPVTRTELRKKPPSQT
jgi:hypothetical protein